QWQQVKGSRNGYYGGEAVKVKGEDEKGLQRLQVILLDLQHLQAIHRDLQAECANCKLLIGKLQILETTLEMYMHPEKHTIDSTALLHELYNDMEKFSLE
nr:hypothetical protein [Tanacetum cinerariifolium]